MKRKFISQKEREKWMIIESKQIIKRLLWSLDFNKKTIQFYESVKDKEICQSAVFNIRKLIIENEEIYKQLKAEKSFLKWLLKRIFEKPQRIEKKESIIIDDDTDNYDNLARDNARENFEKEGWNNYLHNFSK